MAQLKESTCNTRDLGSIPGCGRSPGEWKGYPLQYSGLENSMDCMVHWVAKSQTQLSDFHLLKGMDIFSKLCCCLVAKFCQSLCNTMVYTVHGILQARILEWVAFAFSRGSSLGWEEPLEKGKATQSSILAWRIPWTV